MKKSVKIILTVSLLLVSVLTCFLFAACQKQETYNAQIEFINQGSDAIAALKTGTAKYAVLGEPAATMAGANAGATYRIDLQKEWKTLTGFDGYPQASTVATDNVIENHSAFLQKFLAEMQENVAWIVENASSVTGVLQANGSTSKFPSEQVIKNCNIRFESAIDAKDSVNKYLEIMYSFNESFVGKMPTDNFFSSVKPNKDAVLPTKEGTTAINVVVPDGAPALAIAKLLNDSEFAGYDVHYTIVSGAQEISAAISNGSADIAIMPTNLAAKLFGMGKSIKMVSSNVFGLLYLVGTQEIKDFSELNGEKILCTGQGGTPEFVLKYILDKNNVKTE